VLDPIIASDGAAAFRAARPVRRSCGAKNIEGVVPAAVVVYWNLTRAEKRGRGCTFDPAVWTWPAVQGRAVQRQPDLQYLLNQCAAARPGALCAGHDAAAHAMDAGAADRAKPRAAGLHQHQFPIVSSSRMEVFKSCVGSLAGRPLAVD
jgi:hypothetical protein